MKQNLNITDNDIDSNYTINTKKVLVDLTDLKKIIDDLPNMVNKKDAIVEAVREDLHQRSVLGIKKYGTTLAENNGDMKYFAQMMYEELLDGALYCKKLMLLMKEEKTT